VYGDASSLRFWSRTFLQEAAYGLRRLSATLDPVFISFAIENHFRRIPAGVVVTQNLHEAAITSPFPLNHHNAITALLFGPCSSQSYPDQSSPLNVNCLGLQSPRSRLKLIPALLSLPFVSEVIRLGGPRSTRARPESSSRRTGGHFQVAEMPPQHAMA